MDSPKTTLPAPNAAAVSPPEVSESPFLTYVSNFSPIPMPNSFSGPSTIRELNFSSPPPVFASPHINPMPKQNIFQRCPDLGKLDGPKPSRITFSSGSSSGPKVEKQSDYVDDFIIDPAEDSFSSLVSSNLCSNQALTDVYGQCEASASLPIFSHQQGDREKFEDIPVIGDGAEVGTNDELDEIEPLGLASHTGVNHGFDHNVGLINADDDDGDDANDGKHDEERISLNMVGIESDRNPEAQPMLEANAEKQWKKPMQGGCTSMRRRLEFVSSNLKEIKPPACSSEHETLNSPQNQPIRATENTIYTLPENTRLFQDSPNSSLQENFKLPSSDSPAPKSGGIGLHLNSIGKSLPINGKVISVLNKGREKKGSVICDLDSNNMDAIQPKSHIKLSEGSPKINGDGCKRCNCKKSKCLKLYCDCFANGVFCSDACSCQECLNRVEHKDVVMETRLQIESRNPLAFVPKVVVQDISMASKSCGDTDKHTPASARHKRGCNCKKSQCLKKYCECFQSKVGCTLGCRCEGCKNSFGRKEGSVINDSIATKQLRDEKHGREYHIIADDDEPPDAMPRHLSPITPLIDSTTVKNQSKPPFCTKYHSSPNSISRERNTCDMEARVSISPVCQRASPMTPTSRFGQSRFATEFSFEYDDDSTPDILLQADLAPASGPTAGSPNKKRVLPPQPEAGSSRNVKSRKFVLQSVPSFPSLTPYIKPP